MWLGFFEDFTLCGRAIARIVVPHDGRSKVMKDGRELEDQSMCGLSTMSDCSEVAPQESMMWN